MGDIIGVMTEKFSISHEHSFLTMDYVKAFGMIFVLKVGQHINNDIFNASYYAYLSSISICAIIFLFYW